MARPTNTTGSSLESRPYAGTWKLNGHDFVQQTPDLLVYVNGDTTIPGCRTCSGRIELQRFITQVSVDAGTTPDSLSASISLSIPEHSSHQIFRDGQSLLHNGLEIHIYARGYFPVEGMFGNREAGDTTSANPTHGPAAPEVGYDSSRDRTKAGAGPVKAVQKQLWEQNKDAISAAYPTSRLLGITQEAAAHYGVPAHLIWGTMSIESAGGDTPHPIGPSDPRFSPTAKDDTGFGMSQINLNRWDHIKSKDKKGEIWWGHQDLIDPKKNIWATAFALKKAGVKTEVDARASWFGGKKAHQNNPKVQAQAKELEKFRDLFARRYQVGTKDQGPPSPGELNAAGPAPRVEDASFEVEGESTGTEGDDLLDSLRSYPYYHIFHGVVTTSDIAYAGGFHTGSLNCSGMLHFWQYHLVSQAGSLFGARPAGHGNTHNFTPHNYTGMSPFSIVYDLYKNVAGVTGAVSFALKDETNIDAVQQDTGKSFFQLSQLYWERRFAQRLNSLRMYGANGDMWNTAQQAFLGKVGSGLKGSDRTVALKPNKPKKSTPTGVVGAVKGAVDSAAKDVVKSASALLGATKNSLTAAFTSKKSQPKRAANTAQTSTARDPFAGDPSFKALVRFDPATLQYVSGETQQHALKLNAAQMQAFHLDLSSWGNVNLFESTYQTKMDVVQRVCEITGYEFYEDVDGDFVFKPPFYNLDTSSSPVYRIRPVDVISFNESEKEPEATYMVCKGAGFANLGGTGLEGEWGVRGQYVDWRLVARYGWREGTFETSFYNNPVSMYFAAVNRLDLMNSGIYSGSVQIPFRPEIRPGYPVYIEHLDCHYYVTGIQHSFQFGGQCTTTLTLTAKRAKFYAPGDPANEGIAAIDLSNPYLPPRPLEIEDEQGQPRRAGFPNVVMALDPKQLHPLGSVVDLKALDLSKEQNLRTLLRAARTLGVLALADNPNSNLGVSAQWENGPFKLEVSPGQEMTFDFGDLRTAARGGTPVGGTANSATTQNSAPTNPYVQVLQALLEQAGGNNLGRMNSLRVLNLLDDRKASFGNNAMPGFYRYYSSAHPNPEHQGQNTLAQTATGTTTQAVQMEGVVSHGFVDTTVSKVGTWKPEAQLGRIPVTRGFSLGKGKTLAAHQIQTVLLSRHTAQYDTTSPHLQGRNLSVTRAEAQRVLSDFFRSDRLGSFAPAAPAAEVLGPLVVYSAEVLGPTGAATPVLGDIEFPDGIGTLESRSFADIAKATGRPTQDAVRLVLAKLLVLYAEVLVSWFRAATVDLESKVGPLGNPADGVGAKTNERAYQDLSGLWTSVMAGFGGGRPGQVKSTPKVKVKAKTKDVGTLSPIFPISDSQGYEVVGSYRYGRGLDITPGSTFDQVMKEDPLRLQDPALVEEFLAKMVRTSDNRVRFKENSETSLKLAARLAAQDIPGMGLGFEATPETIGKLTAAEKQTLTARLEGWATKALDGVHKITVANASFNLAQLDSRVDSNQVCTCDFSGANLDLQAFGTEGFVQAEKVQGWLAEQYEEAGRQHLLRRAVLAGSVDNSPGAVANIRAAVEQAGTGAGQAVSTFMGTARDFFDRGRDL